MAAVQERGLKEMMNPVSCQTPSQSRQPAASPPPIALRGEDRGRTGGNMNFSQQEAALLGSFPPPLVLFSCQALAQVSPPDADPGPQACLTGP